MNQLKKINQTVDLDYYSVFDKNGNKICDTSGLEDTIMMCSFDTTRTYRRNKILLDQIVNISWENLDDDKQLSPQNILPDRQQEPFIV
jgi:hypothetical protein